MILIVVGAGVVVVVVIIDAAGRIGRVVAVQASGDAGLQRGEARCRAVATAYGDPPAFGRRLGRGGIDAVAVAAGGVSVADAAAGPAQRRPAERRSVIVIVAPGFVNGSGRCVISVWLAKTHTAAGVAAAVSAADHAAGTAVRRRRGRGQHLVGPQLGKDVIDVQACRQIILGRVRSEAVLPIPPDVVLVDVVMSVEAGLEGEEVLLVFLFLPLRSVLQIETFVARHAVEGSGRRRRR
mmetsp:Transcript_10111/g.28823  ORF Transcript_10111/g.28823 Transcript_10111/m.28823 type:complete len:238 (+) Transcript_10111:764-1477(+)